MNIHLIYEGNKYEFDIPINATIHYIKQLSLKIFKPEEKNINLMYNNENLNNYNENLLLNKFVPEGEKKIIIHLEKPDLNIKNKINQSNISTSDTNNVNDKYFQSMRKKFMKFNSTYLKIIKEISNFDELLEEYIEKIILMIREYEESILKLNEKLNDFYNSKSYDKLIEIFDENQSVGLTEKDLKKLNEEIDSYIINYKYLITQHNFQVNILDFMEQEIDKFKYVKIKLFKVQNEKNYEEIVIFLNKIFSELLLQNKSRNLNNKNFEFENNENKTDTNVSSILKKIGKKNRKVINHFPRIEVRRKNNSPLNYYSQTDRKILINNNSENNINKTKLIRLIKDTENNIFPSASTKNLSPSYKLNSKKSKVISPLESNNSITNINKNILPGLDAVKSETKTESSQVPTVTSTELKLKKKNNNNTNNNMKNNTNYNINNNTNNNINNNTNNNNMNNNNTNINTNNNTNNNITKKNNILNIPDEINENNSRNKKNSILYNDKQNQSMNIINKPKIMDKIFEKKISSRNIKIKDNNDNSFNRTVFHKEERSDSESKFDTLSPTKKRLTKMFILNDFSNSISNTNLLDSKISKNDKSKLEEINTSQINKMINNNSGNNSVDIKEIKNESKEKEIKSKFTIIKEENEENHNSIINENENTINNIKNSKEINKEIESSNKINNKLFNELNQNKNAKSSIKVNDLIRKKSENCILENKLIKTKNSFHHREMKRSITKQSLMKTNFLSKNSIKETNEPIFQQIKNDLLKKKESIKINKNNDEIKIDDTKNENNFKKIENIERQKRQRQRTSRIIQKINIDSYEDTIIKRKLNNKEQIERLTKDLLYPDNKGNNYLTINDTNKEMKEIEKEKENLSYDDTQNNNNNTNEELKKKKKKGVNLFDFII